MKILSLEFSSERRSVALLNDGKVLGSAFESGGRHTRASGLVQAAIGQCGCSEDEVEGIVVGLGPGSNAGIRAAIAFAQGWELAHDLKVAGVGSAELIAVGCWQSGSRGPIDVAIDAQRGDFYVGRFEVSGGGWMESDGLRIVSTDDVTQRIKDGSTVVGPDAILESLGGHRVFPAAENLGFLPLEKSRWVDGGTLQPVYLREPSFVKAPPSRTFV